MLFEEQPLPLVYYDNLLKQTRFKPNAPISGVELIVPHDRLIPFQIRKTIVELEVATAWVIKDKSGNVVATLAHASVQKATTSTFDFHYFKADAAIPLQAGGTLNLDCGEYYSEVTIGGVAYISEVFKAVTYTSPETFNYLKIEYSNPSSINPVYYGDNYVNRIYLDTFITKPRPIITRETEPDGWDNEIIISQKIVQKWLVAAGLMPDFLVQALTFMAINKTISITERKALRTGSVYNVIIDTEDDDMGNQTAVDIEFQQDDIIYRGACDGFDTPMVGNDPDQDGFDGIVDDGENDDNNEYIDI